MKVDSNNQSNWPSKITVIIPTKNEGEMIKKCLSTVFDQSIKPFEVIVIDGNSTDETIKNANQFPVKIIFETEPTSPSQARNIGIQNANGDLLLIMDADNMLNKNCLKSAIQYFEDPTVMSVIPSQEVIADTYLEKIQSKWFFGTLNPLRMGIGTVSPIQFLRRSMIDNIKYDSTLGYGDDDDFHDKLVQSSNKSRRIIYTEKIKTLVHLPHNLRELKSQYIWYGRTFLKYFKKHYSVKTILNLFSLLIPIITLLFLVLTPFLSELFYLFILGFSLIAIRNIIACYRSKSIYFIQFIWLEFTRSLLFLIGMIKGFFVKRIGR